MRICVECGEMYAEDVETCPLDAMPLTSWEEATRVTSDPGPPPPEALDDDALTPLVLLANPLGDEAEDAEDDDEADDADDDDDDDNDGDGHPTIPRLDARNADASRASVPTLAASPMARAAASSPPASSPPASSPPASSPPATGRVLSRRYRLLERMAVGGFGAVFAAEDLRLEKRVAVKVLSPQIAANPDYLARFEQEAIAASQVGHHGIVDVTDFDRDADGTHFIVMELLDGHDLSTMIEARGPLDVDTALGIAAQIADALDHAHRRGILHRDLKPANVFLTSRGGGDPVVKVLDFGISKMLHRRVVPGGLTQSGQVLGTPYYMAPEQALGRPGLDGRVDVYGLGVLLYEMLVGAPPFDGDNYVEIALRQVTVPAPPPSSSRPTLPPAIDALVLRALAKDPDERYPSMAEFRAALAHARIALDLEAAATTELRGDGDGDADALPTEDSTLEDLPSESQVLAAVAATADSNVATAPRLGRRRARESTVPYLSGQMGAVIPRKHRRRSVVWLGVAGVCLAGVTMLDRRMRDQAPAAGASLRAAARAEPPPVDARPATLDAPPAVLAPILPILPPAPRR